MRPTQVAARGFTLVELVMAIVIVAVALAGILVVMNKTAATSADPMRVTQAHGVARAYLEEILLQAYADPDGTDAGETRPTFDDVDDYNALAANGCTATTPACPALGDCACDQFGTPIAALAGYGVTVAVTTTTLNGAAAKRVDVSVTHGASTLARLSGFRTNY